MVLTRSKTKLLESSPKADLADLTISADNFSRARRSKANVQTSVFKEKGLLGCETQFKIFQQSTARGVFRMASTQVPPNSDEERYVGGSSEESSSVFSIYDVAVIDSVTKSGSSKRSWPALEKLIEQMIETSHAKKAYYRLKATHAEKYSMPNCMTVLESMTEVSGQQYGRAAAKLVESKDWRTFFLLSPPDKQLAWINSHAEKHSMADCMTVLASMTEVSGRQYGRAAAKLVESKDWRTFFLLSPPDKQLAWINSLK